jgi:hypothetical protein
LVIRKNEDIPMIDPINIISLRMKKAKYVFVELKCFQCGKEREKAGKWGDSYLISDISEL